MPALDLLDWMKHRPAQSNQAFFLPPGAETAPVAAPGYFQLRLTQMRLTDDRRWFKEIVPAAFVITEFNHGPQRARRPFFVSNGLLPFVPAGVNVDQLRVNFRNTLVLGPTPDVGGDVVLFVGLFQMAIKDQRKSAFSVLEKLFQVMPGPVGDYLKLADKLADEIASCLGDENLSCLLGDRSTLGDGLPPAGYQVYLKANGAPLDKSTLAVVEDTLMQQKNGQLVPVTDRDYCFVKVEHLAQRNDYASLPFHAVFETARQSLVKGDSDTARLQMLECIGMVYGSLDLSEDDKARLIAFYQAKLLAIQTVRGGAANGAPSPVLRMQARALQVGGIEGKALAGSLDVVRALHTQFKDEKVDANVPVNNDDVLRYLETPTAPAQRVSAAALMKAVAVSSLAS
jgi:hypothetical protein